MPTRSLYVTLTHVTDVPRPSEVLWPDPDRGPWRVQIWWRAQHGVPTPVGLSITSWIGEEEARPGAPHNALPVGTYEAELPRIGRALLRDLPVGALVEATRGQLHDSLQAEVEGARQRAAQEERPARRAVAEARRDNVEEQTAPLRKAFNASRRGRDLGDDHYRQVAAIYTGALREGEPPTTAVARWLAGKGGGDPRSVKGFKSTAAKQVARARERAFLPKTTKGRVGPATEEL